MRFLTFLNGNKRLAIALLSVFFVGCMLLPVASVQLENGQQSKTVGISVLNAASEIQKVKDALGIDEVDTRGIDELHPKDEIEKTTLLLKKAVGDIDLSVGMSFLAILIVVISAMVVYVRPKSVAGSLLFVCVPFLVVLSQSFAVSGFNNINQNIGLYRDYFGLDRAIKGFSFQLTAMFYFLIFLSVFTAILNISLRKPKQENNEEEKLTKFIIMLCAVISVSTVFFITIFLLVQGIPTISKIRFYEFLFTSKWDPVGEDPKFGIANLIVTSFVGTFGAILIGVPLGILVAIFISQLTTKKLSVLLASMVNLLAGIPSVIYGAVGAILLVPFIQKLFHISTGMTLFTAILVLSIMVLPTIISVTVTSLNAVPKTYLEASLALGLTKEASIFKILIPAARSGIMTGVLLGLGRAIGEAMAIILVAGNVPQFPKLLEPARFLTTGIVAEMGYATGLHRDALFAIGLVLFFFILVLNSVFRYFIKKASEKYE